MTHEQGNAAHRPLRQMTPRRGLCALAVAAGALALLLTLPAAPAEAVDCGSAEQGTYDRDSDTFAPGTAASDIDYSMACTDDDGDSLVYLDPSDLPAGLQTGSYLVLNLSGTAPFNGSPNGSFHYVIKPSGIETSETNRDGVLVYTGDNHNLWVEVRGPVTTRGDGGMGVLVHTEGSGTATAINRGTINTHGGVDTSGQEDYDSHGLFAGSEQGSAFVTNHGYIEARGNKAEGLIAYTGASGTATATNYGTAIVRGGVHLQVNQVGTDASSIGRPTATTAVQAYSEIGDAHATNVAGGTAEAHGDGSTGVEAAVGGHRLTGGAGSAVAENFGTVTSTGSVYEVNDPNNAHHGETRAPTGVAAYSQGAGGARAVNHAGGTIESTGDGAEGISAWTGGDGTGDAMATNRGSIVTRGNRVVSEVWEWWLPAVGIGVYSDHGNATAVNDAGGTVDTHGTRAHGVYVEASEGTATARNSGNITTHNTAADPDDVFAYAAYGMWARAHIGNAEVVNESSGSVTTKGPWGFGIIAETQNDGASTSASAQAVNKGRITTEGDDADGALAIGAGGGAQSNSNVIIARNEAGATIATTGDRSDGVIAAINAGEAGTAYGSVRAENHGTIVSSGANEGDAAVRALFFTFSETVTITEAGDATVVNSGDVTTTGAGAFGLRAQTFGSGTATVNMTGGTVIASAEDDPATADVDESGVGIEASTGATGTANVTVSGNSVVRAPIAARLLGGTTSLLLNNGQLVGNVEFGDGTNTLETRGFGLIDGDVSFGTGQDTLIIDAALSELGVGGINGTVTGLEDMIKRGPGIARVHDVMFSGSSLIVEEGGLNVRGHLDLGMDGTVTVEDATRLTMEIGDVGTDPDDHGQITAGGGVTLKGDAPAVFAAYDEGLDEAEKTAAQQHLQMEGFTPFSETTPVMTPGASEVVLKTETGTGEETVGTVSNDGMAMLDQGMDLGTAPESAMGPTVPDETVPDETVPTGHVSEDGRDRNAGAIGVGAALAFVFLMFDLMPGDEEPEASGFAAVPPPTGQAGSETGTRYWAHALTDETAVAAGTAGSIRGLRMGFSTGIGDGFQLGLSGTPQVETGLGDASFEGHSYALRGGWSSELLFANVGLSRGDYTARTALSNLDGLGALGGTYGLRHEQARADVGARLELGGLRVDPSLSLYAGSLDQSAYTAASAALRSEMPALSQRYDGWKASVSFAPEDWLEAGSVRWRPELSLATARTSTDGPDDLSVRQADRAGVLSFTTPARAQELPQTVHALGTSVSIAQADDWKLRGGYLAMMADDELIHAAVARFQLRF